MRIQNLQIGGLGNVALSVPHSQFVIISNIDNSKGSSLTFSALCTRNRQHCIRSLSDCTERFLTHVNGPSDSDVANLPPTVTVRRGIVTHGPQSAINATARVCSCLQLLFSHIKRAFSPVSNVRIGYRAARSIVTCVNRRRMKSDIVILTPVTAAAPLSGFLTVGDRRKCGHICFNSDFSHVSSFLATRLGSVHSVSTASIDVIVSHLHVTSSGSCRSHLCSAVSATFCRNRNVVCILFPSDSGRLTAFSIHFRTSNVAFRGPASGVFTFGSPTKTYPVYSNCNAIVNVSRGLIIPGPSLSMCSSYIRY